MVDINLKGPGCIKGYEPWVIDEHIELEAGDHIVPVNFHLLVPEGHKYRVNLHIEVTGVM